MNERILQIYTDGACKGNPGPGGWGAILIWNDVTKEISGFDECTTNNRMEMTAAINALKEVKKAVRIKLYTDSQYLKNGITAWVKVWLKNGWNKGKVKNQDLWSELINVSQSQQIEWCWVKAHNGNYYNERVDKIASNAINLINK